MEEAVKVAFKGMEQRLDRIEKDQEKIMSRVDRLTRIVLWGGGAVSAFLVGTANGQVLVEYFFRLH